MPLTAREQAGRMHGLSPTAVNGLARAYDLTAQAVRDDVARVQRWNETADDLVVWLEQRHAWPAEMAVSYLTIIKRLQTGSSL
jgi:hypothetical protein